MVHVLDRTCEKTYFVCPEVRSYYLSAMLDAKKRAVDKWKISCQGNMLTLHIRGHGGSHLIAFHQRPYQVLEA